MGPHNRNVNDEFLEYLYVTGQLNDCNTMKERLKDIYLMYDTNNDTYLATEDDELEDKKNMCIKRKRS